MSTINAPQSRIINNIQFRVYKENLIDGGLAMVEGIEDRNDPITTIGNISLIPKDSTNMFFVLKFDSLQRRDAYRDYVFTTGEGKQFGYLKFPEILADYQIGEVPYILIAVRPSLDENALSDDAMFHGLPIDIEKIAQAGEGIHATVKKL